LGAENAFGDSQACTHVDSILAGCGVHDLHEQADGSIGDTFLSYDSINRKRQQTNVGT